MKKTISLLAILVLLSGCTVEAYENNASTTVVTTVAETETISNVLQFSSVLTGEKETVVAAKTSGQITELTVNIGDPVIKNQNLGSLGGETLIAQQGGAWSTYQNAMSTLGTIQNLYDEKIDSAEASLLTYAENTTAAEKDWNNEKDLSEEQLEQAELALESVQINEQLLKESFDQEEVGIYENMKSLLTQSTILVKNSVTYLYGMNNRPLSENRLEVDSHFTVSGQQRTEAENAIREYKSYALDLESVYNSLNGSWENLEEGKAVAKETLEIGKDTIQEMYNIVVESGASGFISSSDLSQYELTLSDYGSQIESMLMEFTSLDLSLSELDINRTNQLLAAENAVNRAEQAIALLQASSNSAGDGKESAYLIQKSALEQAREMVDMAEAEKQMQVQLAQAQVDQARSQLSIVSTQVADTRLLAPYDGVVAEKLLDEGSIVTMGTPILKVVDISNLKLVIYVPEEQVRYIQVGQQGIATSSSFPEEEFTATVERISPTTEENSKKVRVELSLPNENQWLKIGMYMDLELKLGEDKEAIVIPEEALQIVSGEEVVYVIENGLVAMRPITRGETVDGLVEIIEGVSAGEEIVTKGWSLISEGEPVQIYNQTENESETE